MSRFIDERKNNWQKLEGLLEILETSPLRGLPRAQVRELGELYRRAASDLAIARAESRDPKLVNYLNSLVIRAHGRIYRADAKGAGLIWQFFARDFPQAFRRTWRYTALAFAVFMLFGVASFLLCYYDLNFADELGLGSIRLAVQTDLHWWNRINDANQVEASGILTNNILVALRAFAFGAFFGIGTLYVLIYNGLLIGGVLGVCYAINPAFGNSLVTFMVGHGVVELSCIFIAGGAGMYIGYSMINPGDLSRGQALKKNGMEAARLAIGCACLLVIAGIIEGFLSPSMLPPWIKFGTGILTGVAMYSYLLLVGREDEKKNQTTDLHG
ncbi:MAG TPA: stage II sporulation protein M [Pyrinomonadaceae bacterium]|nr:stage II sporulation protein M [Pyrinomonadaceae bacterium]